MNVVLVRHGKGDNLNDNTKIPIGAISIEICVQRNQKSAAIAFRDCNHFRKDLKFYSL